MKNDQKKMLGPAQHFWPCKFEDHEQREITSVSGEHVYTIIKAQTFGDYLEVSPSARHEKSPLVDIVVHER